VPKFGKASQKQLATAHPDLQALFNEVIKTVDCAVLCGFRDQEQQNKEYDEGDSKLKWPKSKHNKKPALAVDVVPYPVDWKNEKRFYHFAGYVQAVADRLGIKVKWGIDWDLPHWEIVL
jgi:peptidoglycan LD-endopeptidase CwlK